jgi:demethylmenaquinone methyltransferase/2-methoxy-6-polyprenyl-1,4-benzoquinol methylase
VGYVETQNQGKEIIHGLSMETWRKVVKAIEDSIPLYDQVNDVISLGKAREARSFALGRLALKDGFCVLDGGIGPGVTSKLILSAIKPSLLIGLDGSIKQLKTVRETLSPLWGDVVQVVRGSFEFLPFRDDTFDAITTCYALRDSLDMSRSLGEYWRVCNRNGSFADVDIGKPESALKRAASIFYVRCIMPFMAMFAIRGRIRGNPWKMIVPTYKSLPTNVELLTMVKQRFPGVEFKQFLRGGIIVIIGRKSLRANGQE